MYFTLVAAIIRAGHVVFPISPRNSPAAIAYLLSKMGAMYIFVGSEDALQDLAAAAFRNLSDSKNRVPIQAQFPTFADAYEAGIADPFEPLPPLQFEWNDPLVILHSSGSVFDICETKMIKMWTLRCDCFPKAACLYTRAVCISLSCTL